MARLRLRVLAVLASLALAGCAGSISPPPSSADMPFATGLGDPVNSVQFAAWAFAARSRLAGDPATAARAVAALDSAAGVLSTSPRFIGLDPFAKQGMLQGRVAVRHVLGIAPNAPSQQVVDSMVTVNWALSNNDRAGALKALSLPIYTFGPERTLAILTNMPFVRAANIGTMTANVDLNNDGNGPGCIWCH